MIYRSILFYIFFYLGTIFYFLIFSPVKIFTKSFTLKISKFWTYCVLSLCKHILLIEYEISGKENIPNKPILITSNHQSAWETFFLYYTFNDPIFLLKKELSILPILGSYFKKLGFLFVDRESGFSSIKKIIYSMRNEELKNNRSIIIFPEGTRVKPNEIKKLNSGVILLHQSLCMPILPVTHDSGKFWINKRFKKNNGKIKVKIHPPLEENLEKKVVLEKLKNVFEENINSDLE